LANYTVENAVVVKKADIFIEHRCW